MAVRQQIGIRGGVEVIIAPFLDFETTGSNWTADSEIHAEAFYNRYTIESESDWLFFVTAPDDS